MAATLSRGTARTSRPSEAAESVMPKSRPLPRTVSALMRTPFENTAVSPFSKCTFTALPTVVPSVWATGATRTPPKMQAPSDVTTSAARSGR